MEEELIRIMNEEELSELCVIDFDLSLNGMLLTHIYFYDGSLHYWSGDIDDKYSEEIVIDDEEELYNVINEIIDLYY